MMRRILIGIAIGIPALALVVVAVGFGYDEWVNEDKVGRSVSAAGVDVSGLSVAAAAAAIADYEERLATEPTTFSVDGKQVTLVGSAVGLEVDEDKLATAAIESRRRGGLFTDFTGWVSSWWSPVELAVPITIDEALLFHVALYEAFNREFVYVVYRAQMCPGGKAMYEGDDLAEMERVLGDRTRFLGDWMFLKRARLMVASNAYALLSRNLLRVKSEIEVPVPRIYQLHTYALFFIALFLLLPFVSWHSVGVVLAAGTGSRLRRGSRPKPLVRLGGLSLIERAVVTAQRAGVTDVYVVVGFRGDEVAAHLASVSARRNIAITPAGPNGWPRNDPDAPWPEISASLWRWPSWVLAWHRQGEGARGRTPGPRRLAESQHRRNGMRH